MDTIKFPKSLKILLPCALLVAVLTLVMPRKGEFEYHYSKGSRWNYETLVAPFDFPVLKTKEQIRNEEEKMGSVYVPYYRYSEDVFRQMSRAIRLAVPDSTESVAISLIELLEPYYDKGVLPDVNEYGMDYLVSDELLYIQRNKRAVKVARSEMNSLSSVINHIEDVYSGSMSDTVLRSASAYDLLAPNLIFDKNTTELVHKETSVEVSPTSGIFRSGDIIVSSGEIVTADIEQILDSFKAEYENNVGYNGPNYLIWVANFLLSIILVSMLFFLVLCSKPSIMENANEFYFILCVFLLSSIATFIFGKFPEIYIYLMPYPVFALFYLAFFRRKLVLPLYAVSLLPLLVFNQDGSQLYLMNLFAGFAGVWAFSYFNRGWRQFVAAICIFLASLFVFITFKLLGGMLFEVSYVDIIFLFLGALLCVLTYPLIYLFEIAFSLVSENRLVELTDTSNPLLRQLAEKTPGTFQHSLAVMNMAEAAGRCVDANVPLLRAAALYHDIGKMMNPQCFVENQAPGVDYHKDLTPKESAVEIIRHISDGVSIAEKGGIPVVIRDFIKSHHGTTSTGYFYTKFMNEGGKAEDASVFFYPGPRPSNKEQVILMLCDALEAASRTIKDYSFESVSLFVDDICGTKQSEGQFDDAAITLRELSEIRSTLKNYIVQMHHGRIVYPNRKTSEGNN